jgi:hypothetical protein
LRKDTPERAGYEALVIEEWNNDGYGHEAERMKAEG